MSTAAAGNPVTAKDILAVPLGWLADLDECAAPEALTDAVGDRYLCRYNPVFAGVRRAALRRGYQFSSRDTELWRDYKAFPLITLHRILEERTIPYLDNGGCFSRLVASHRQVRLPVGFLLDNLKPNHAFHESAHCVAHAVMGNMEFGEESSRLWFVIRSLFAESFANTVEALGGATISKPLSDAFFYGLNSYHGCAHKEKMQAAKDRMGDELRFTVSFLAHFEANLSASAADSDTYKRVADAATCKVEDFETVSGLTDHCFKLSERFRNETTPAYFALLGCAGEYQALVKERWLEQDDNARLAGQLARSLYVEINT